MKISLDGPADKDVSRKLTVKSFALLVIRCSDYKKSLFFYKGLGLSFSTFRMANGGKTVH